MNEILIEKLGPKTVKRSNVKYKGGEMIPCNQCGYAFKSTSSLNNHKTYEHSLSFSSSQKAVEPRNSTRNNSFTSSLMIEDLTTYSSNEFDKDSVTLEESSNKNEAEAEDPSINCDWQPCNYKSKQRRMLIKHIDEHIGPKSVHNDGDTPTEQIGQGSDDSKMEKSVL